MWKNCQDKCRADNLNGIQFWGENLFKEFGNTENGAISENSSHHLKTVVVLVRKLILIELFRRTSITIIHIFSII